MLSDAAARTQVLHLCTAKQAAALVHESQATMVCAATAAAAAAAVARDHTVKAYMLLLNAVPMSWCNLPTICA
jgi:hypothetical protein